jgi:hypothetical protein
VEASASTLQGTGSVVGAAHRATRVPAGIRFHRETLRRVGHTGDNWCITWAADGDQVTSMDDGNWLNGPHSYNNHLYRVIGDADNFTRADVPGYPQFYFNEAGWFGYGICSVDGTWWCFVSKCPQNHWSGPFQGVKLLKSSDAGATWYRVNQNGEERLLKPLDPARYSVDADEMFFWKDEGVEAQGGTAYPFASCAFAQRGMDNRAARDDFVYVYSPEGARPYELLLARAPKQSFGKRVTWEYFSGWRGGEPQWNAELGGRVPVHRFPDSDGEGAVLGWYSWLPSVVWNESLGLYIMVNGGTYGGSGLSARREDFYSGWMHTRSGSLGFWYAADPWGPWIQFHYQEEWTVDSPENRTYQPKLSPKWISENGQRMVLIWSDAMKDKEGRSHTVNYRWNQMELTLDLRESGTR